MHKERAVLTLNVSPDSSRCPVHPAADYSDLLGGEYRNDDGLKRTCGDRAHTTRFDRLRRWPEELLGNG
jgi:hypothetical protein